MAKRAPKHFFSKFASVSKSRSLFDYSNTDTVAFGVDYLYPNYVDFVLPGDTWVMDYTNSILMVDPIKTPMRDNLYADTFWFFVPWRLNWQNTKYFFGEEDRSGQDIEYSIPQISATTSDIVVNSIFDFMGIPISGTDNLISNTTPIKFNALPLRAYNLIYDEWFRDELRQDYSYYNVGDSDTAASEYKLLKRGKRFDYFTSTTLQPILTASGTVDINLGGTAPVRGDGTALLFQDINNASLNSNNVFTLQTGTSSSSQTACFTRLNEISGGTFLPNTNSGTTHYNTAKAVVGYANGFQSPNTKTGLVADLSSASAISISSLQTAFQMQSYYYQLGIGGTRYREYLYTMYGVISPDARMQVPEFLGKTHQRLDVVPVVQNSESATTPQGTLTAIVKSNHSSSVFTRSFTEHGFIIGLFNIYADLTYYQGLDRFWSWSTPFDIPLPVFSNLIDEAVLRKEILFTNTSADNTAWGYQERYAYAKIKKNTVRGLIRPNAPQTLGIWSLAQQFDNTLTNNGDFISLDTPIERITADTENDNPHFIVNQLFNCKLTRELPLHSNPQLWMFGGY